MINPWAVLQCLQAPPLKVPDQAGEGRTGFATEPSTVTKADLES